MIGVNVQEAEPGPGPASGWSYLVPSLLPDSGPPTHILSVSRGKRPLHLPPTAFLLCPPLPATCRPHPNPPTYLFPPLGPLRSLRGHVSLAPLSPSPPVQAPPAAPAVDFGSPSDTPCCFPAAGTCQRVWAHRGCGCGRTILTASLAGQRIVFLQRASGTAVCHPRVPGSCWDGGTQPPPPRVRLQDLFSAEVPGRCLLYLGPPGADKAASPGIAPPPPLHICLEGVAARAQLQGLTPSGLGLRVWSPQHPCIQRLPSGPRAASLQDRRHS
ncbi:hypothetical protein CapIbe_020346 [Capra ibex]